MFITWGPGPIVQIQGARVSIGSYTFMEIDCEIIFCGHFSPSAESRRVVVSYKQKYVHKVLVNQSIGKKSVVR